ncbi:hypothetical protein HDU96_003164 [Phlyctochytrium bullatum]|nr:hypothetical protein HDU96_003164 [Phlyctochytrium bullatum]
MSGGGGGGAGKRRRESAEDYKNSRVRSRYDSDDATYNNSRGIREREVRQPDRYDRSRVEPVRKYDQVEVVERNEYQKRYDSKGKYYERRQDGGSSRDARTSARSDSDGGGSSSSLGGGTRNERQYTKRQKRSGQAEGYGSNDGRSGYDSADRSNGGRQKDGFRHSGASNRHEPKGGSSSKARDAGAKDREHRYDKIRRVDVDRYDRENQHDFAETHHKRRKSDGFRDPRASERYESDMDLSPSHRDGRKRHRGGRSRDDSDRADKYARSREDDEPAKDRQRDERFGEQNMDADIGVDDRSQRENPEPDFQELNDNDSVAEAAEEEHKKAVEAIKEPLQKVGQRAFEWLYAGLLSVSSSHYLRHREVKDNQYALHSVEETIESGAEVPQMFEGYENVFAQYLRGPKPAQADRIKILAEIHKKTEENEEMAYNKLVTAVGELGATLAVRLHYQSRIAAVTRQMEELFKLRKKARSEADTLKQLRQEIDELRPRVEKRHLLFTEVNARYEKILQRTSEFCNLSDDDFTVWLQKKSWQEKATDQVTDNSWVENVRAELREIFEHHPKKDEEITRLSNLANEIVHLRNSQFLKDSRPHSIKMESEIKKENDY